LTETVPPPAKKKSLPKLHELDIVRAIAILAVVAIHATSEATVELPVGSTAQAVYLAVNKLCNFAVPVFILLSGVVLFYRYSNDWGAKQGVTFYLRRVKQVVIPYLVWSLFYYLYNQWIFSRNTLHFDWRAFLDLLPWADASYHLYFMTIIVQFYLLFPLLMTLCRKWAWFRRSLFLFGLLVQAAFYCYNRYVSPVEHVPSLAVTYFAVFAVGGQIGLYYQPFIEWLRKHISWVLPLSLIIGASFAGSILMEQYKLVRLNGVWYEVMFHSYAIFVAMSFIWFGRGLLNKWKSAAQWLIRLGAVSFGIYLVHPAVLTYWHTRVERATGDILLYHAYTLGGFAATLFVPWILVAAYGKFMSLWRKKTKPQPAKA
jgi:peptidoglycan/LPS O-acetylase OafA/YrhL